MGDPNKGFEEEVSEIMRAVRRVPNQEMDWINLDGLDKLRPTILYWRVASSLLDTRRSVFLKAVLTDSSC